LPHVLSKQKKHLQPRCEIAGAKVLIQYEGLLLLSHIKKRQYSIGGKRWKCLVEKVVNF